MTAPLLSYAEENKICLQGMIYGREGTNFFKNGVRTGLYRLYAPIQTGRKKRKNSLDLVHTPGFILFSDSKDIKANAPITHGRERKSQA